jgi:hypothetical protein
MWISCRGSDKGGALFISVMFIFIFSILFLSVVSYISSLGMNAKIFKERVITDIIEDNNEVLREYDIR